MKFFIKRLGCPKNYVDADFLAGRLIKMGHQPTDDAGNSEIAIVNTCGFILPAKEESIEEIMVFEKLKKEGTIKYLFITGCLAQRYGQELLDEIEGVDGVFGLGEFEALARVIEKGSEKEDSLKITPASHLRYLADDSRHINKKVPYEYIKISDGCDRFCGYCAIPSIRGRFRSRPIKDIVREAEILAQAGKKEIILVSQEGTGFGRDFRDGTKPVKLLSELEKVEGIEWIRLIYLHPEAVDDELIEYISSSEKMLGYFDIPLQHINDAVLKRMNRHITRAQIESILKRIRSSSKNNIIRTTFIAGLPGETEAEFTELRDFIIDFEFDRLGAFKYSVEEGTPAAEMPDQLSEEEKETRVDELMTIQQEIAFRENISLIDSIQKVIIDSTGSNSLSNGRTKGDCPEIDQTVFIRKGKVKVGEIVDARILMADGYDLIASVESENNDKI
jgi:ribosomal protein S12 methylthiotransferase